MKSATLKTYPFSLLTTLVILITGSTLVVMLSLSGLLRYQGRQTDWLMSEKLLQSRGELVQHAIEGYLDKPRQANNLLAHYLRHRPATAPLPTDIQEELEHLIEQDFSNTMELRRISFASASGQYVAIARHSTNGKAYLVSTAGPHHQQLITYSGIRSDSGIVRQVQHYNLLNRPWFVRASRQESAFWSPNYLHMSANDGIVTSYRTPLYDAQRHFIGVISSDLHPSDLNRYLQQIAPFENSLLLIVDDQQHIIAINTPHLIPRLHSPAPDPNRHNFARLPTLHDNPMLKTRVPQAALRPENTGRVMAITHRDREWLTLATHLEDRSHQLKWRAILIVPRDTPVAVLNHYRLLTWCGSTLLVLLSLLILIAVIARFTGPLKKLATRVKDLGRKPWIPQKNTRLFPEIAILETELGNASQIMSEAFTLQRRQLVEDPETHLLTRTGLLHSPLLNDDRNLLAIIYVSNFSTVKNTLGSALARQFIYNFAQKLNSLLPAGSLCCRDGDDRFVVVFPGANEAKDVDYYQALLEPLFREQLSEARPSEEPSHVFTGCSGIVLEKLVREKMTDTLMNASLALQHAQSRGNGACVLFTPQMREEEVNNIRLHQALRDDLQDEGFHLVLQPIVSLNDEGTCQEGECLIRWQSRVLGFVPPDKFIGLAEDTGIIVPLGRWIIETACRELAEFIGRGAPPNFKLHINVSAIQLQQPDFSRHLLESIQRSGLANSNICLEITESVLLQDTHHIVETLSYLRRLGLSVAIDDFGSGYSSLSYLHSLPFDCLKIDRGFVRDVMDDSKSEAIIASVLMLSRSLQVPLVAEGIETAAMADRLREMGCDLAQGYYYARPLPFANFHPENGTLTIQPANR
jgi:EAL domain-containing protein (putative c-di-GMP-specific phosphodiesterase class I)/GGDEF domain-containing protein